MHSIQSILKTRYEILLPYLEKNKIEAYRLYHPQSGPWPVAVDIYQDNAVVHFFGPIPETFIDELESALKSLLNIREFFYKDRSGKGAGVAVGEAQGKEITVEEYGHKFALNLSDYLDTGLFLDHRETRLWVESQSKDKVVLNTFAYTGSFTIYAAAGGATKTYSVDLSRTYTDWIKKNLELNGLPLEKNWTYKMDTLEFFRYAKRKGITFDIIIIDPPTFSKNKGENFSVERDYPALLNGALDLLNPDGFIVFSNNCKDFHLDPKKIIPCKVRQEFKLIPPDFEGVEPHHCYIVENI